MSNLSYPEFFDKMSKLNVPDGVRAWVMSDRAQVVFYELPEGSPPADEQTEGAEWGLIVEGKVEITMNGETRTYGKGDTYYIPGGVPHRVVNHPGVVGIDVFERPDRFTEIKD
ncbi:cupin domain-containing protein [Planotetraspora sp. GP83]|uniref:cupin domain-containing protein n=1 Tax=Planotetraspora sp. GP83 TaxID=3156264 RepID=UPI003515B103